MLARGAYQPAQEPDAAPSPPLRERTCPLAYRLSGLSKPTEAPCSAELGSKGIHPVIDLL